MKADSLKTLFSKKVCWAKGEVLLYRKSRLLEILKTSHAWECLIGNGPEGNYRSVGNIASGIVSNVRQMLLSRRCLMQFIIQFRCLLPNHTCISWYISASPIRAIKAGSNRNILDLYFLRSCLLSFFSCASQGWRIHLPASLNLLQSPSLYKTQSELAQR
jgi:hypothetical protein